MKKAWSLLCAVLLTANLTAALPTAAAESADGTEDAVILATGLITNHYVSVSNSGGQLCINGYTKASETMKSIGFTDIQIERSSNGTSGWTAVQYPDDVLASNTNTCSFNNYKVSVVKGYYYRVTCTHYAKESGLKNLLKKTPTNLVKWVLHLNRTGGVL
ncbi:MAG: hypothetical protein IJN11_03125 [Oscillospiraceae bacterium]|nr:hypothetical protein [Oscillospiraceae bacterium]